MEWRRKWQPTPVFFPGESKGQGSLVGCRLWGRTESDTTERLSSSSSVCTQSHDTFVTSWTVAQQVPLSMGFSRQEYWSGCHALHQGIFLTQGSNLHLLMSPVLAGGFFTINATWEAPVYPEKTII